MSIISEKRSGDLGELSGIFVYPETLAGRDTQRVVYPRPKGADGDVEDVKDDKKLTTLYQYLIRPCSRQLARGSRMKVLVTHPTVQFRDIRS